MNKQHSHKPICKICGVVHKPKEPLSKERKKQMIDLANRVSEEQHDRETLVYERGFEAGAKAEREKGKSWHFDGDELVITKGKWVVDRYKKQLSNNKGER